MAHIRNKTTRFAIDLIWKGIQNTFQALIGNLKHVGVIYIISVLNVNIYEWGYFQYIRPITTYKCCLLAMDLPTQIILETSSESSTAEFILRVLDIYTTEPWRKRPLFFLTWS